MAEDSLLSEYKSINYSSEIVALSQLKPNDPLVWGSFSDGTIRIFDPSNSDPPQELMRREGEKFHILTEFLGQMVAFSESGELFVWDACLNLILNEKTSHEGKVQCAKVSKSRKLWTADSAGIVFVWGPGEEDALDTVVKIQLDEPVFCMEEVGRTMWLGSIGKIFKIHGFSYALIETWVAHGGTNVLGMVLSGTGVWSYSDSLPICVWDSETSELQKTIIDLDANFVHLIALPCAQLVSCSKKSFILWDGTTYLPSDTVTNAHNSPIQYLYYFERSGYTMISCSQDGILKTWCTHKRRTIAFGSNRAQGIQHKHKLKTKIVKKSTCAGCKQGIRGQSLRCSDCKIECHSNCQSELPIECSTVTSLSAFPGVPMYSMIDTEPSSSSVSTPKKETLELRGGSCGGNSGTGSTVISGKEEMKIRLRFFESLSSEKPLVERNFSANLKATVCKTELVIAAADHWRSRDMKNRSSSPSTRSPSPSLGSLRQSPSSDDSQFSQHNAPQRNKAFNWSYRKSMAVSPNAATTFLRNGALELEDGEESGGVGNASNRAAPALTTSEVKSSYRNTTMGSASLSPSSSRPRGQTARRAFPLGVPADKVIVLRSTTDLLKAAGIRSNPSEYVYKVPGFDIYILKEDLPLHRLQFVQACKSGLLPPIIDVVPIRYMNTYLEENELDSSDLKAAEEYFEAKGRKLFSKDLDVKTTIKSLMAGNPFESFVNRQNTEVLDFRRALTLERLKWYEEREQLLAQDRHRLPRYYCNSIPQELVERYDTHIKVEGHLYLPSQDSVKKTINPHCMTRADSVLESLFDAIIKTVPQGTKGLSVSDYIMKVPGLSEYLYGDVPLIHFDYIRSTISSGNRVSLRLIYLDDVKHISEMHSAPMEKTLADQILSQQSLSAETEQISIYTIKDKLSVTISDIFGIPSESFETSFEEDDKKKDKAGDAPKMMAVEASVLFGDLLVDQGHTKPIQAGTQLHFSEEEGEIKFNSIKIQNIARGTRICYTLLLLIGEKKIPLFWVNKQMISHDSKSNTWTLTSGSQSLLMWEEGEKGVVNLYKSIGICSENVGPMDAPQLVVNYPSQKYEVVFPPLPRSITPEEVLERLSDPTKNDVKRDLFDLKERLKEPGFKEPFLEKDGLKLLCNAVRLLSGNVLSYALGALEVCLEVSLTSGIGWESITLEDIEHIVLLTDAYHSGQKPNLNASKSAFRFLSYMIELPAALDSCHLGFPIVYKALTNVAQKNHREQFFTLISGLKNHADIDISLESLRLINKLFEFAPSVETKQKLISSLVDAGLNKIMLQVLTLRNMAILKECARYQQLRFDMLEEDRKTMHDSSDQAHEAMLMKLWENVFPKKKLQSRISSQWGDLGFQGKDPSTDFRGGGLLGLRHLLYISSAHKKEFRSIISQYNKTEDMLQYPVCVGGIEISDMLFQMFQIGRYNTGDQKVFRILFDDEKDRALEEMYVSIFKCLNKMWYEMKAGYMDWPNVKAKLLEKVKAAFETCSTVKDFGKFLSGTLKKTPEGSPFIQIDESQAGEATSLSSRMKEIEGILSEDSLYRLLPQEKKTLWHERHLLVRNPNALCKFILSVDFQDHQQVLQCYRLLDQWAKPSPQQSIELLDARFTDPMVRAYAVSRLDDYSDEDCEQICLQLCQVLKYEAYHDSSLARFLVRRAYRNDKIGHQFFWNLRAELHAPEIAERFCLLLEGYVRGCGQKRSVLLNQHEVISTLITVAGKVKAHPLGERKSVLHPGLKRAEKVLHEKFGDSLLLALDHRLEAKSIVVDKCKSMESKQVPLWLVFENADPMGERISVILKVGDDLRQDALTLQMMRLMDRLWKNAGMNLGLNLYGCVATGYGLGMIEVVKNAETTAGIQREAGGATTSVLSDNVIANWLMMHNPGTQFQQAQLNFAKSCAGYCVATYVLGIADRHNDNIMITKDGFLLHIDFGHFLGNYKKKFGYRRETTPFVFTPQYAYVLKRGEKTSPAYETFKELCTKAYNIVRHEAALFLNLFQLMLCGGIQELQSSDDISHLRRALSLSSGDEEAGSKFRKKISEARGNKRQKLMDIAHLWNTK